MLSIALTGGIGSGKSAASAIFHELGAPIIDADQIAHALTAVGTVSFKAILDYFGDTFANEDGSLNRNKIRKAVFNDSDKKQWLESLLHPIIRKTMFEQAHQHRDKPFCLFIIPLLIESKNYADFDRVCVIDCEKNQQIDRATRRDQLSELEINAILNSQATREDRLGAADDVILNNGSLEKLQDQILNLNGFYIQLSKEKCTNT